MSMKMLHLQKGQLLLSRFSLVELLGQGGMGQVWLAEDVELQERVAIKVLSPLLLATPEQVQLLKDECRNTRRLVHPHIVRIFDFHRSDDVVFISMEFVDGEDLDTRRRRLGTLPYADLVIRLLPIVEALSYAHGLGLIHRDLKAGNVLLDRQGVPRLADFGIAAVLQPHRDGRNVSSSGSRYSMSPQQLEGKNPHPADDLYSLGVLMYELLTGHPPFYPDITPEKIHREVPSPV
ncbi:MAG: serine/threonine protein kinase, partial [Deltaproteobacteria bacterium]